ncbi:N-6 DNA methylase [Proteus mirabilis]|nr:MULTISPECIES: N-6 DNA methylase [Proteus]AND13326.1 N-6 DNA methylase [Proteus mirabilis]KSA06490.1 N-6 DNA methylase [Proteus mirabilis]MCW3198502.1 N-6 DNA methylase [Proteus mirabilis]MDC9754679.1 N-6 DNA methylase [Proteus mirabilis]MDF7193124.1 N-6 DNA methylase [Proteus mirabilis]
MEKLAQYNKYLMKNIKSLDANFFPNLVDLNSIDKILRSILPLEEMREAGCFFTGEDLSVKAIDSFCKSISSQSIILDPTCGAGNLLIACSRKLKIEVTLSKTLQLWGNILRGYDLYAAFVTTAKLRIIIEALSRGAHSDCNIDEALDLLPFIQTRDAMTVTAKDVEKITHVIMNPPFNSWLSPRINYWKQGKVNSAGIILDHYIRILPNHCNISAILPDVLRSGSRYHHFRDFISSEMKATCEIYGRFNSQTDVDVFILSGIKTENNLEKIEWVVDLGNYTPLSKFFDVCIGPLVAYRDPEEGNEYPYFHAKNSLVWEEISTSTEKRRFQGKVLTPPLILIKRTSSPSDKFRASATLINLSGPVAVENHMIVLIPKTGKLSDCRKLIKILKSEKTNDFLNSRARMRHLTVSIVKDIPID